VGPHFKEANNFLWPFQLSSAGRREMIREIRHEFVLVLFLVSSGTDILISVVLVRSDGMVRLGRYGPSFLKIRRPSVFW